MVDKTERTWYGIRIVEEHRASYIGGSRVRNGNDKYQGASNSNTQYIAIAIVAIIIIGASAQWYMSTTPDPIPLDTGNERWYIGGIKSGDTSIYTFTYMLNVVSGNDYIEFSEVDFIVPCEVRRGDSFSLGNDIYEIVAWYENHIEIRRIN